MKPNGYTVVDTNGKVIRTGNQGVRIVSEDKIHLLDMSEVSDESVVNVFVFTAKGISLSYSDFHGQWEIIQPRLEMDENPEGVEAVCEHCGGYCDYHSILCLCDNCKIEAAST